MPALSIQWIKRVSYPRQTLMSLHLNLPGIFILLCQKLVVNLGITKHSRIEDGVITYQAFFGQLVTIVRCFDHQQLHWHARRQSPHSRARDHNVIPFCYLKVTVITVEVTFSLVYEKQIVAVCVTSQLLHRLITMPETILTMGVMQNNRSRKRRVAFS